MFRNPLRKYVYVQVHRGHVLARVAGTNASARVMSSALDHPRTLMGDFGEVTSCLKSALKELKRSERMLLKPRLLVHLIPNLDGGYTNVELRAFREAGDSAGGYRTFLLADHDPISDEEVFTVYGHFS